MSLKNIKVETVSFRNFAPEIKNTRYSIHYLHSYPAQLISHIPYYFINQYSKKNEKSKVFDPFCGTGTVLVESLKNNISSIGIDINPVAALISEVKTTLIEPVQLQYALDTIINDYDKEEFVNELLPDFENLYYWFTEGTVKDLVKIKSLILKIDNIKIKNFFLVIFSSIIKDVSKSDPKIYVPVLQKQKNDKRECDPLQIFLNKAKINIKIMDHFYNKYKNNDAKSKIINKDIHNIKYLYKNIDLVITSPPYISAQKYVRSTRLEAYWLGYNKNEQLLINKNTIGTEKIAKSEYKNIIYTNHTKIDDKIKLIFNINQERAAIVSKYFISMEKILKYIYKILSSEGLFILIIGNNTVTKYIIPTNEFLMELAEEEGFIINRIMRDEIKNRSLMTSRNSTAGIIDYEWVIKMKKP